MPGLTGVTIGITAERRGEEFAEALERNGAKVWHAPTIRITPLADDDALRSATHQILAESIDLTVVTTGAGFRGWLDAAEGWGLATSLLETLSNTEILVRGSKAEGAVRARGLTEAWSAKDETNAELFDKVLAAGVLDKRVIVQLHGTPLPKYTDALRAAGSSLVEVQPYRWQWPTDLSPVRGLLRAVLARRVHALAFTSAPAATNLLTIAANDGTYERLVHALRTDVVCACVGSVTAEPLAAIGVPTIQPERQRLGALVKLLVRELGN